MNRDELNKLWYEASMGYNDQNCDPDVIERFAELVVDKCADAVIDSDPSVKMVLHEPYRTVMDNVLRVFDEDKDE